MHDRIDEMVDCLVDYLESAVDRPVDYVEQEYDEVKSEIAETSVIEETGVALGYFGVAPG